MTAVTFRELTAEDIERYVAAGEWQGRAGAYAIQGLGAALVERIDGDYLNVVGLPAALLITLASRGGLHLDQSIHVRGQTPDMAQLITARLAPVRRRQTPRARRRPSAHSRQTCRARSVRRGTAAWLRGRATAG